MYESTCHSLLVQICFFSLFPSGWAVRYIITWQRKGAKERTGGSDCFQEGQKMTPTSSVWHCVQQSTGSMISWWQNHISFNPNNKHNEYLISQQPSAPWGSLFREEKKSAKSNFHKNCLACHGEDGDPNICDVDVQEDRFAPSSSKPSRAGKIFVKYWKANTKISQNS